MTMRTVLLAAALVLVSVPAHAADEVGLSRDGVTWSTSLAQPLFDPGFRWVPGDVESERFYVRNQGPSGAEMTVEVVSADPDDLLENDDLAISARAGSGDWITLENGVPSAELTAEAIAMGGVAPVDVRVEFVWESPNRSQTRVLPLVLRVTLVGDAPGGDGDADGDDGGIGFLPDAGSLVSIALVWAAALAIGAGLALVIRRRDREDAHV